MLPVTEQTHSDNGTLIFEFRYQNMYTPTVGDPDVAEKVMLELLNRIDSNRSLAENVLAGAKADYNGSTNWVPYFYSIQYNPMRVDAGVLSLYGQHVSFGGSSHPSAMAVSVTYNLQTGEALKLGDILTDSCDAEAFSRLVISALGKMVDTHSLYSDYARSVENRFARSFWQDEGWYFSPDGLCVYFSPYEVAPYSSGTVIAEIPYEALTGLLRDEYFPMEKLPVPGQILTMPFSVSELDRFDRFAEVVLDRKGESVILYTDGMAYDVTIESGSWNATGTVFVPASTVFAASSLTPGAAITVQDDLSGALPGLRINYESGGENISLYLARTADGSYKLIEK
jgi:hypothetical protein